MPTPFVNIKINIYDKMLLKYTTKSYKIHRDFSYRVIMLYDYVLLKE